jgi:hypothetical protein
MLRKTEDFNMTDISKITKEEFDAVYNKYPANRWTKVAFRYFSTNTLPQDMFVKNTMKYTLIGLFLIGLIGTILSLPRLLIVIATLTFTGILVLLGILMFSAFIMNNSRINKIRKELGLTRVEYDICSNQFYG